ncbi:UxaA family hydrolase [Desulfosporosinus sp. SYSU MS00001]|uniref:UxaA family hydrolase n=1 Tax=Desulfosporosinus sp. SYSU MS00001 TaxID=3416284 RepID=UPI003CEA06A3
MDLLKLNARDNVAVALKNLRAGEIVSYNEGEVCPLRDIPGGHKVALQEIHAGEAIIKYGFPIGKAVEDIPQGQWVHTHNLKTNLGEVLTYHYSPGKTDSVNPASTATFQGFRRTDGKVGIRNEIWVIPTVSCVNRIAELIAKTAGETLKQRETIDGVFEFKHPYGCSQMGEDQLLTQQILADLIHHPNAGGVLVLGLGCENSNITEIKKRLGDYDPERVKFMVAQEVEDEIETGVQLILQLADYVQSFKREGCSVAELTVGLKCGGSDGFSGITANPLVGRFSDRLIAQGGSTILTEVPEMFGAETILMNRALNQEVFEKTVSLINNFKAYYASYEQPIYENPSPGNKQGGISSLEDKALGCTQKGGHSQVVDVLKYAERVHAKGLNLLSAPGNDMVASTALAAAGCQLILFTTGRGTPLGTCVPTLKIATNSELFKHKTNWMDFNAGRLLEGLSMDDLAQEFWDHVLTIANGNKTQSEKLGFREIAIFKSGVTL